MDRERLLELAQQAEQRQRASLEAIKEFIQKHTHATYNRAKKLTATGMDRTQAFQQAVKENSNSTYEPIKIPVDITKSKC